MFHVCRLRFTTTIATLPGLHDRATSTAHLPGALRFFRRLSVAGTELPDELENIASRRLLEEGAAAT